MNSKENKVSEKQRTRADIDTIMGIATHIAVQGPAEVRWAAAEELYDLYLEKRAAAPAAYPANAFLESVREMKKASDSLKSAPTSRIAKNRLERATAKAGTYYPIVSADDFVDAANMDIGLFTGALEDYRNLTNAQA